MDLTQVKFLFFQYKGFNDLDNELAVSESACVCARVNVSSFLQ